MIIELEKHRKISLIITLVLALEIFFFSNISISGKVTDSIPKFDFSLIYHFTIFFLFAFFLFITIKGKGKIKAKSIFLVLLITISYSFLDEIHQGFIPSRTSSIFDVLVNNLGIFSASFIYLLENYKNKRN